MSTFYDCIDLQLLATAAKDLPALHFGLPCSCILAPKPSRLKLAGCP